MSSIVLFDDKKDCCGCGACMNVCPKNAIRMAEDEVGFVYPEIDQNLCVGCGACKKACGYQAQPLMQSMQLNRTMTICCESLHLVEHLLSLQRMC